MLVKIMQIDKNIINNMSNEHLLKKKIIILIYKFFKRRLAGL
jgi:hypothetical protein